MRPTLQSRFHFVSGDVIWKETQLRSTGKKPGPSVLIEAKPDKRMGGQIKPRGEFINILYLILLRQLILAQEEEKIKKNPRQDPTHSEVNNGGRSTNPRSDQFLIRLR